jgi:hypothetical protein
MSLREEGVENIMRNESRLESINNLAFYNLCHLSNNTGNMYRTGPTAQLNATQNKDVEANITDQIYFIKTKYIFKL